MAIAALFACTGCNTGRPINYAPQVTQNLSYLQRTVTEMAESATAEFAKSTPADQMVPLLAAITRGSVSEVQMSVGGFYWVDSKKYEPVYQGGSGGGARDLDPVEKAQLDVLVEQVVLTKKYNEGVNSFYEREVAQVAAPVMVNGNVAAVAWIRRQLPSELKNVTEPRKFDNSATTHQTGQ